MNTRSAAIVTLWTVLMLAGCEGAPQRITLGGGTPVEPPLVAVENRVEIDVDAVRARADEGDAQAEYEMGLLYDAGREVPQDSVEALKWFRAAAEKEFADAQFSLGLAYAQGQGVEQDLDEALRWYRAAAAGGSAKAQLNLGAWYDLGEMVSQDYAMALDYYRQAADQGLGMAYFNIGVLHANGNGVPQDCVEAVVWFTRAVWESVPGADAAVQHCFEQLTEDQQAEAKRRAATEAGPSREKTDDGVAQAEAPVH